MIPFALGTKLLSNILISPDGTTAGDVPDTSLNWSFGDRIHRRGKLCRAAPLSIDDETSVLKFENITRTNASTVSRPWYPWHY